MVIYMSEETCVDSSISGRIARTSSNITNTGKLHVLNTSFSWTNGYLYKALIDIMTN